MRKKKGRIYGGKAHTDVFTDPSKISCAGISSQSRSSVKTDYADKLDPFEWHVDLPLRRSKINADQSARSVGGASERGLGERYHGGSVRERQPLKKAEPSIRAPEFLLLFLSTLSPYRQHGDEEEDQFRAEEQKSVGGEV